MLETSLNDNIFLLQIYHDIHTFVKLLSTTQDIVLSLILKITSDPTLPITCGLSLSAYQPLYRPAAPCLPITGALKSPAAAGTNPNRGKKEIPARRLILSSPQTRALNSLINTQRNGRAECIRNVVVSLGDAHTRDDDDDGPEGNSIFQSEPFVNCRGCSLYARFLPSYLFF